MTDLDLSDDKDIPDKKGGVSEQLGPYNKGAMGAPRAHAISKV